MTKREKRVVDAFIRCVESGEFTPNYAILLIEDDKRYGWLSDTAKDAFYEALDALEPEEAEAVSEAEEPEE